MPKRRIANASTSTRTAWAKRERRKLMASLERQQERDQVHVLLRRQRLAEHRRHHALGEARHRSRAGGIEDLLHDVVGGLDLRDLREIRTDRRGADLARLVARDAADRKSTRLNSSHLVISYAVFCLKKKIPSSITGTAEAGHTDL